MKKVSILLVALMCNCAFGDLIVDLSFSGDSMQNFGTAGETAYLDGGSPIVFADGVATSKDPSVVSRALDLRGIDDSITIGTLAAGQGGIVDNLAGLKSFTVCFWVNGAKLLNKTPLNRRENSGLYDYNMQIRTDAYGRPYAYVNDTRSAPISNGAFPYENRWAFMAMTYDSTKSTDQIGFYRNDINATSASLFGITQTLDVGALNASDFPLWFGKKCDVLIDNIRVYGSKIDSSGDLSNDDSLKWIFWNDMQTAEVPEPASITLLGLGMLFWRKKRN